MGKLRPLSIVVYLSADDKKLVEDAAHKNRVRVSSWARSVLVDTAQDQLGVKS